MMDQSLLSRGRDCDGAEDEGGAHPQYALPLWLGGGCSRIGEEPSPHGQPHSDSGGSGPWEHMRHRQPTRLHLSTSQPTAHEVDHAMVVEGREDGGLI